MILLGHQNQISPTPCDTYILPKKKKINREKNNCFYKNQIGGMDISFHPKNPLNACAYFAVFSYPEMEVNKFLNFPRTSSF